MPKLPFMQFFPADWLQDTQVLTLEGQGAWIKVICALHVSPTYGTRSWTKPELMTYLGIPYDETLGEILVQLDRVADIEARDIDENVARSFSDAWFITITCRRMVRDWKRLTARQNTHKKYNDKRTTAKRQRNDTKTTAIYQKSEVRSQKSYIRSQKILLRKRIKNRLRRSLRLTLKSRNQRNSIRPLRQ